MTQRLSVFFILVCAVVALSLQVFVSAGRDDTSDLLNRMVSPTPTLAPTCSDGNSTRNVIYCDIAPEWSVDPTNDDDILQAHEGDDWIYVVDHASGGMDDVLPIDGGEGDDMLTFRLYVDDWYIYQSMVNELNMSNPASGSLYHPQTNQTYQWTNFETLVADLQYTGAPTMTPTSIPIWNPPKCMDDIDIIMCNIAPEEGGNNDDVLNVSGPEDTWVYIQDGADGGVDDTLHVVGNVGHDILRFQLFIDDYNDLVWLSDQIRNADPAAGSFVSPENGDTYSWQDFEELSPEFIYTGATATPTATDEPAPTFTAIPATNTSTATDGPPPTFTAIPTTTLTRHPSSTPIPHTNTPTATHTWYPSNTPTWYPSNTPYVCGDRPPTRTPVPTQGGGGPADYLPPASIIDPNCVTATPTDGPSPTHTATDGPSPTYTLTPAPTLTATDGPSPTHTPRPTNTAGPPTLTPTPITPTLTPTSTPGSNGFPALERFYPANGQTITGLDTWPRFQFEALDGVTWYQVWIGSDDYTQLVHAEGYEASSICSNGVCTLPDDIWLTNNDYVWWMTYWGPDYNIFDAYWHQTFFEVAISTPPLPANLTVPNPSASNPAFTWNHSANALWYHVILAPEDFAWVYDMGWHQAVNLNCSDDGICTYINPLLIGSALPAGDYIFYVLAWGPGGSSIGGTSGYAEGSFSYAP